MLFQNESASSHFKSPIPYWHSFDTLPKFPSLTENITTEIGIVGGGIVGIISAYLLAKAGKKVVLLEADRLISGTTGHTTAKITAQHSLIYNDLINTIGEKKARQYYEANLDGLQFIKETASALDVQCDFEEKDAFVYAETEKGKKKLEKEAQAYHTLGIHGGLAKEQTDLPFDIKEALVMYQQAQFHPVKFLTGLVDAFIRMGGKIYEQTRVSEVLKERPPLIVTEHQHLVLCQKVIIASHYPVNDKEDLYFTRLSINRSYAIAIQSEKAIPEGMYINAEKPTHSLRSIPTDSGETLLLIGGEGHPTGKSKGKTIFHYRDLEQFGEQHFSAKETRFFWSTQDLQSLDQVPYIGQMTKNNADIFVATGFNKWGMAAGATAGMLLSDLLLGYDNPYETLFDPNRPKLTLKDAQTFLKKNTAVGKDFIAGKVSRPSTSLDELHQNEGGLVMVDGHKIGAYRDDQGQLHQIKPVCTHLGCSLSWNDAERSWDCACHGSRFSYTGEVLDGPAVHPLKKPDE